MTSSLLPPLISAATSTFEALGFLLATPLSTEGEPLPRTVHVAFRGPREGRVELRVSESLMGVLAANMLGLDAPPTLAMQRDALGELANVIAGNLVPALDGPRAVYLLDAPVHGGRASVGGAATRVRLVFDEGVAEVCIVVGDAAVAA